MIQTLKKSYFMMLLPAAAALAVLAAARAARPAPLLQWMPALPVEPWLIFLAVVLAVAAPVMLRAVFAHRMRHRKATPQAVFLRFQKRVLCVALLTPYVAICAWLVKTAASCQAGVFLAALYAAYYYFPSKRRIDFDRRIFRVEPGEC